MTVLVMILLLVVVALLSVLWFGVQNARQKTEIAARNMAESFVREAKIEAEKKARSAADAAVKGVRDASNEDLERRVRYLVRRDGVP